MMPKNRNITPRKILIFCILVFAFFFLATHGLIIVTSENDVTAAFSKEPETQKFTNSKKTRHLALVRSGGWFVSIKDGYEQTGKFEYAWPFMIPKRIHLNLSAQYKSSKIASDGKQCVLYDDPSANISLVSTCNNDDNKVSLISNGNEATNFESSATISATAPSPDGAVFLTTENTSSGFRFVVTHFSPKNQQSKTLLKSASRYKPYLVQSSKTGYLGGVLVDSKYYRYTDLERNIVSPTLLNSYSPSGNTTVLSQQHEDKLYLYTGGSLDSEEGESTVNQTTTQTLRVFSLRNGTQEKVVNISKRFLMRELALGNEGTVAFIGEDKNADSVICILKESLVCSKPWGNKDFPTSLLFLENKLIYVANGNIWAYSPDDKTTNLVYSAAPLIVNRVKPLAGVLYLSASKSGSDSGSTVYDFALYPSVKAENRRRIDSVVPLSVGEQDDIAVDVYRSTLQVYDYTESTTTQSIKEALLGKSINVTPYSFTNVAIKAEKQPAPIIISGP